MNNPHKKILILLMTFQNRATVNLHTMKFELIYFFKLTKKAAIKPFP